MKTKKLTPRNAAPVQRENTATVSREGNAMMIAPHQSLWDTIKLSKNYGGYTP